MLYYSIHRERNKYVLLSHRIAEQVYHRTTISLEDKMYNI